jgi:hypothetical protein
MEEGGDEIPPSSSVKWSAPYKDGLLARSCQHAVHHADCRLGPFVGPLRERSRVPISVRCPSRCVDGPVVLPNTALARSGMITSIESSRAAIRS